MSNEFGSHVSLMRILGGFEAAEKTAVAVSADRGMPSLRLVIPTGPHHAARITYARTPSILSVDGLRNVAQIAKRIVGWVAVSVVNVVCRPAPVDHEPRKSVRKVGVLPNRYPPITIMPATTSNAASAAALEPAKLACLWIVLQHVACMLRGKIVRSHDAVPSQSGQRPASVDALRRLRYFSA